MPEKKDLFAKQMYFLFSSFFIGNIPVHSGQYQSIKCCFIPFKNDLSRFCK